MGFLVHSFNDMTKRLRRAHDEATRSQQAVERERARLAIILARLSTGVLALDRTLTVRIANHAAGAILGSDLSAATGQLLPDVAASNERLGQFVAALAVRFAAGREEWREQIDLDTASSRRTLMCACTPLPSVDSDVGYIIVFDDITTLLQAQRDAAWGEVARRLAHEIKNPLTPIRLSAERMRKRFLASMIPEDAEVLERATRTIVQQVETMQQMVNAFSEYARAPEMQVTRFALNALIAEVADLYRSLDRRADIRLELDQRIGNIEADRGRVRQLFNNLVTNALEALEGTAEPHLDITSRLEQGRRLHLRRRHGLRQRARLPARAAGAGVRSIRHQQIQGHRPRARDRQEDRRRTRRAHRGGQSSRGRRAHTRGAADERQYEVVDREPARSPRRIAEGKGMSSRILVVDDEADIRSLLKEILSEEGYEVDIAANAAQARAARLRQTPDLVLLDIWMPDVDGITLLREWSNNATNGCPVVMMSGHGTVETAVEATRLGAFDFVEKPLSLAKLLRTVERALDAGQAAPAIG